MVNQNYDRLMEREIAGIEEGKRPRLLLHSCCGPCSTAVTERLSEHFDFTVFFYNPNITDAKEYQRRLKTQIRFLEARYGEGKEDCFLGIEEGVYDPKRFEAFAEKMSSEPEGGRRCALCFEMRLRETGKKAKEEDYDYFTTTLTVSPMKNAQVINSLGMKIGEEMGVSFLPSDFKKRAGYQRSIELSREYELYRQHFCGCRYSAANGGGTFGAEEKKEG